MQKYTLEIEDHFDSAHYLRKYCGKCANIHGHSWKVAIRVSSTTLNTSEMVIDFKILKKLLKEEMEKFDHKMLNEVPPFDTINPTAENLAKEIFLSINGKLPQEIKMESATVWESPYASATYTEY